MPHIRPRAFPPALSRVDITLGEDDDTGRGEASRGAAGDYTAKVIALIPVESVAAYQAVYNLTDNGTDSFFWILVLVIWVLTPAWQLYSTANKGEPRAWDQAILSIFAFLIWLAGLQSPFFNYPSGWEPRHSAMVLVVGAFVLPILGFAIRGAAAFVGKRRGGGS